MSKGAYSILVTLLALLLISPIAGINHSSVEQNSSLFSSVNDNSARGDYEVSIEFDEILITAPGASGDSLRRIIDEMARPRLKMSVRAHRIYRAWADLKRDLFKVWPKEHYPELEELMDNAILATYLAAEELEEKGL